MEAVPAEQKQRIMAVEKALLVAPYITIFWRASSKRFWKEALFMPYKHRPMLPVFVKNTFAQEGGYNVVMHF